LILKGLSVICRIGPWYKIRDKKGKTMIFKQATCFSVIFAGCFIHELWIGHELVPILLRTLGLTTALLGAVLWLKLRPQ
jgi:hypothetical protein